MNELEQQFLKALMHGVESSRKECNYNPNYFLQMLDDYGALGAARRLITGDNPSSGFTRLWECKRLDLTVEAIALTPPYRDLFTEEELTLARERLRDYRYEVE
jgi:hypothetical protein